MRGALGVRWRRPDKAPLSRRLRSECDCSVTARVLGSRQKASQKHACLAFRTPPPDVPQALLSLNMPSLGRQTASFSRRLCFHAFLQQTAIATLKTPVRKGVSARGPSLPDASVPVTLGGSDSGPAGSSQPGFLGPPQSPAAHGQHGPQLLSNFSFALSRTP